MVGHQCFEEADGSLAVLVEQEKEFLDCPSAEYSGPRFLDQSLSYT
jgi:hypothetical protein